MIRYAISIVVSRAIIWTGLTWLTWSAALFVAWNTHRQRLRVCCFSRAPNSIGTKSLDLVRGTGLPRVKRPAGYSPKLSRFRDSRYSFFRVNKKKTSPPPPGRNQNHAVNVYRLCVLLRLLPNSRNHSPQWCRCSLYIHRYSLVASREKRQGKA